MSKHTPTPWFYVPWHIEEGQSAVRAGSINGWLIANTSGDEDAKIIATAVNSHASLTECVKVLREALKNSQNMLGMFVDFGNDDIAKECKRQSDAALSRAKELVP